MRRSLFALGLALVSLAACESSTTAPQPQSIETTSFASLLGVDLAHSTKTSTGVYYRDITVGTGKTIATGDTVYTRYTGYLSNGTVFDTNEPNGAYLPFTVGAGSVIPGFEAGFVGMKYGGRRQIIIPPDQGYGMRSQGVIPGGSILVFVVTACRSSTTCA